MDFSEIYRHSGLVRWSPDGKYIAAVDKHRLVIRDAETLEMRAIRTNLDQTKKLEWSSDSQYVLCAQLDRAIVQVWSVDDEQRDWSCQINEGLAGLSSCRWAPDGRHILTATEFQLRLTIWSLINKSVFYIKAPKFSEKGIDFSHDGRYLAVAERKDFKDYVGVYDTETWEQLQYFQTDTQDLNDVKWAPSEHSLIVWDSSLDYQFCVYSLDGRKKAEYSAYENALGIKSVAWARSSQFLAVGSYDERVRLFNHITWKLLADYKHVDQLSKSDGANVVIYEEVDFEAPLQQGEESQPPQQKKGAKSALVRGEPAQIVRTKYELGRLPLTIPDVKPDPDKPNPKLGVGMMAWSCDDRFLVTKNDNQPNVVWIWDTTRLSLASILLQQSPVRTAVWDPCRSRLAIATQNNKLYMWTKQGCSIIPVPADNFTVRGIRWNMDGNSLVLIDKARFCCCYL